MLLERLVLSFWGRGEGDGMCGVRICLVLFHEGG